MIRVLQGGMLTTVQDMGRIGHQRYGVPVAGAMDRRSFCMANLLVGNGENDAALEITLIGPTLLFEQSAWIAVTGGNLSPARNGAPVKMYCSVFMRAGDTLSFGAPVTGCRAYVAFAGGIDVPLVMGSRSTHIKSHMGGYAGRKLDKDDVLRLRPCAAPPLFSRAAAPEDFAGCVRTLRVVLGPQEECFTRAGIQTFLSERYSVTDQSDRMGCRMTGKKIEQVKGADIISDGISFGAVQIPSAGTPIVMLADRQTTGGYTKIAHVISVDLPLAAQLKPGDGVRFESVSIEEAQALWIAEVEGRAALMARLREAPRLLPGSHRDCALKVDGASYQVSWDEMETNV